MAIFRLQCNNRRLGMLELNNKPVAIGRHPDNDVVIDEDLASRFHAVIEPAGEAGYRLKDLGSRNGTKLNGQKIAEVLISGGDIISIGQHQWSVEVVESKQDRRQAARAKTKEADPVWVVDLREVIENMPPKSSADEAIVLIDADGRPSDALASDDAEGARALRLLLLASSKARATDIHMEPKGDSVAVRVRVDGQMVSIVELPNAVGELAMGVVRVACQLKAQGRDATYDGHCSARFQDRRVDFRASFTPTVQGQKLVLRILDSRDAPTNLTDLQFPAWMHQRVRRLCEQDAGMLLCCGPTGSGKTTTLYNCLREIDRQKRNVVTIEDPVEYHIDGVTQIPVGVNATFGQLLRSVLRQDPDVILVGEIRDEETARTGMQAAMTGHVVFSTVHSKDSIGAVFRLLDLGIEPYLIANSMDIIIAQRLVRVLCEHCKRQVRVTPGQATRLGRFLEGKDHTFAATGCTRCLRTGFRGRRGIYEMLDFNDELRDIVLKNPTIQGMKKIIEQGVFTTLQQAGWVMAARGVTSLDEAEKVASWS